MAGRKYSSPKRAGHSSPRPIKSGGAVRTGRPTETARGGLADPPDVRPDPSSFLVEGRVDVVAWTSERRTRFNDLLKIADFFGLVVQEFDPSLEAPRRSWTRKRASLDDMEVLIERTPGIRFDAWVEGFLLGSPKGDLLLAAARKRATQALSRLYADHRVVKRYDEDGNLILYVPEHAPKKDVA